MPNQVNRRKLIKQVLTGSAALAAGVSLPTPLLAASENNNSDPLSLKGNINHSVCYWCYGNLSLEQMCLEVKKIGFGAIDLLKPDEWPIAKKHGLHCSMCYTAGETSLTKGWNDKANHMPLAEKHGVIIQIELFNSKIDHKDYMGDKSAWGIELCKRLGSPNFKILFDIYHMQIDEGDIIRSIQDNHQYFGHYHTAGVPGRHEIDERQELYYPAIMRAIAATGYKGYVAQEFIPKDKDAMASLKKAIQICDI